VLERWRRARAILSELEPELRYEAAKVVIQAESSRPASLPAAEPNLRERAPHETKRPRRADGCRGRIAGLNQEIARLTEARECPAEIVGSGGCGGEASGTTEGK